MLITAQILQEKREAILEIARRYGALDVRIFGSVVRGDATDASDIDLIVRFEVGRTLLDHGGLVMDLRELLAMRVDVIMKTPCVPDSPKLLWPRRSRYEIGPAAFARRA